MSPASHRRESPIISRRRFLGARVRLHAGARLAVLDTCLTRSRIACRSCADACPEDCLRITPRAGAAPAFDVDEQTCTGCGACVRACPASALRIVSRPAR